jgi:sugar/nucleoside kinase (ribokinase family)
MAGEGCLVLHGSEIVRVHAPSFHVVDGCGAGATFSAGYIYGYLHGWDLEKSARFATAAGSLKVTRPGLRMFPIDEISRVAAQLAVERHETINLPDQ